MTYIYYKDPGGGRHNGRLLIYDIVAHMYFMCTQINRKEMSEKEHVNKIKKRKRRSLKSAQAQNQHVRVQVYHSPLV